MKAPVFLSLFSLLGADAIAVRRDNNPTFVIVPGAWHVPWHFSFLIDELNLFGYNSIPVSLPTVSKYGPWQPYSADVNAVNQTLEAQVNAGNDVIMVMHSYGGAPGSAAVKGLTKAARQTEGKKGGVIGLVYIAAFAFDTGLGFPNVDISSLTWFNINGPYVSVNNPTATFYADVTPAALQQAAVMHIQNFSTAGFSGVESYGAWRDVHPVYITTTQDQALPPAFQKSFYTQAGAKGGWNVQSIASGHAPFLSHTNWVANVLATFAKNLTSNGW